MPIPNLDLFVDDNRGPQLEFGGARTFHLGDDNFRLCWHRLHRLSSPGKAGMMPPNPRPRDELNMV